MNNQHDNTHSWRRLLFIAFPPLAAVLFAFTLTLPALAATVFNVTVPVNLTIGTCNDGEVVTISGLVHEIFLLTFDGSGGVHVDFHENFEDVTGVGSLGNTYHAPVAENSSFNAVVGHESTITVSELFVSQGSAPNFSLKENVHITVNPDGTVTSFDSDFTTQCQS